MYRTNERIPETILAKIPHPYDRKLLASVCSKNQPFTAGLTAEYLRVSRRAGFVQANNRLKQLHRSLKLGNTGLSASADDQEITDYSEAIAKVMKLETIKRIGSMGPEAAVQKARADLRRLGVAFPVPEDAGESETVSAMLKLKDPIWWRRQLRTMQARIIENIARDVRRVGVDRGLYCSDWTVTRRAKQKRRNAEMLANMEAENEEGFTASLLELSEKSLANPANRRAELMVRIRGFEEVAELMGHIGLFVTITCPSKYHRMMQRAGKSFANPKWAGLTPRDGQDYHRKVWQSIRAEWNREGIRPYGLRVTEPNHDGTPHWHLQLFIEKERAIRLVSILRRLCLSEDGDENGAKKYRVTVKRIDPSKGTAAGYIAKYIAKNIDGFGLDDEGGSDNARRVEAWASTYRMRQFQQIGGPSVGVWRELRRLDAGTEKGLSPWMITAPQAVKMAYHEAAAANWAAFVLVMGGPQVRRADQLIKAAYQETESCYLEITRTVVGIECAGNITRTRLHTWTVQRKGESQRKIERLELQRRSDTDLYMDISEEMGVPYRVPRFADDLPPLGGYSGAGTAPPWTCVNNCNSSQNGGNEWRN